MWEVSKLPIGYLPYKEYFTCPRELQQMSSQHTMMYETFRELMFHFKICLDVHGVRGNVNGLKSWVDYLFSRLDSTQKNFMP